MARKIFHSFRFSLDYWRVQTVREIGSIEGQKLLAPNAWEEVLKKGEAAIQKWIDEQLSGRSCVVVLIGAETNGRKWVKYEMTKAWLDGKGVVGVHIHRLKDSNQAQASKGKNPLAEVTVSTKAGNKTLSAVAKTYDPPFTDSKKAYGYIADNLEDWIEEAIKIRKAN